MTTDEGMALHHHGIHEAIAGSEELVGAGGKQRGINLLFFSGVMAFIEVLDVILTRNLNFADGSGVAHSIIHFVSVTGNVLFAVMLVFSIIIVVIARRSTPWIALPAMVVYLSVASLNVLTNIVVMISSSETGSASQLSLIADLGLMFVSITLIFSLWYQVIDSATPHGAFDFPPCGPDPEVPPKWFDYLVLSFNTNSTFGPTTEGVKSRVAKGLMMLQTSLALTVLVVLTARIIKAT